MLDLHHVWCFLDPLDTLSRCAGASFTLFQPQCTLQIRLLNKLTNSYFRESFPILKALCLFSLFNATFQRMFVWFGLPALQTRSSRGYVPP